MFIKINYIYLFNDYKVYASITTVYALIPILLIHYTEYYELFSIYISIYKIIILN